MSLKENDEYFSRLLGYEEDMQDDYKSWQDAEKEIEGAIAWRDKMALNYANSAVRYYKHKNKEF
jgi:hypothetical protein